MGGRSMVFDLARQLSRVGDPATLDVPIEAVAERMTVAVAREALEDLARAGVAGTLREALEDDRLDAFAADNCTEREEQALCRALSSLMGSGRGGVGDDDPARLAEVDAPPREARALERWAKQYGVQAALARAADAALPAATGLPQGTTLADCVVGAGAEAGAARPLAGHDLADEAAELLVALARAAAARIARSRLWGGQGDGEVPDGLVRRLRAAVEGPGVGGLAGQRFVPARPVQLDLATGIASGQLLAADGHASGVRLYLSGHELRGLIGACERCGEGMCLHVQALAGRLLDAALSPDDRLRAGLAEFARAPSWRRFVDAVVAEPEPAHDAAAHGQLSFRLTPQGRRLDVSVLLHKPRRGGGYSTGRQLPVARAARSLAVSERDRPVLQALTQGSRPLSTVSVPADPVILRALSAHPHVRLGPEAAPVSVSETSLHVEFEEQGDGLMPRVTMGGAELPRRITAGGSQYLYRHVPGRDAVLFAPLSPPLRRLLQALDAFRGVLPPESFEALGPWLAELRQVAKVTAPGALSGMELPVSRQLLLRLSSGVGDAIHAALSARPLPLGALWPPGHGPQVVHGMLDGRAVFGRRDLDWERSTATELLAALDMRAHPLLEPFVYRIDGTEAVLALLSGAARLRSKLTLEWSERARRVSLGPTLRRADLKVRMFKKGHWLHVEGGAVSGERRVAVGKLLEAAERGERFVRVEGDSYVEIERALREQLERSRLCAFSLEDLVRVPAAAAPAWAGDLAGLCQAGDTETGAWLAQAARASALPGATGDAGSAHGDDAGELGALPVEFTDRLRSYQRRGIAWLVRMGRWAPGACLADEMGLGKTVQAIGLLLLRAERGPALVVAPTSVAPNWCAELARFAPGLTVHAYRSPSALPGASGLSGLSELGAGDVVVVSYELLARGPEAFADCRFATQVVDESQWVKNARTGRARAVGGVQAEFRLALSGTPVENRLGDLWSLMSLVAPGLLGDWARFRALFAVPIERYENEERAARLRDVVAPFILRRTKAEVAAELPPRTEVLHRVELSKAERELYGAAVVSAREALRRRRKHDDGGRTAHVLAELTRLRQLACHPELVLGPGAAESSKLAALDALLADILPRGHRALIFSQFVGHLALVRALLERRGLRYLYLDGSTPASQRGALVERFQARQAPLFLISLKAGGTGLNLTAADYVIHLDPWWNPAAEDQASDRAHRLGQGKPVTIVKLVAEGTIEERVLALHAHKRALADSLLSDRADPVPLDLATLEGLLG